MKQIKIKSGLMLVPLLLVTLLLSGCVEKEDFMESNIIDMNDNITAIDKAVIQPGDVLTVTGKDLDKVYKIMLNTDNVPVVFTVVSSSELKLTIPATAPLGDVVTINFFFSGKGLAQRGIRIISPPVIYAMSPEAAQPLETITVLGKELHLAKVVRINNVDVTDTMVIESDKILYVVTPEGFTGGDLTIETESGGISTSPYPLLLGTEIMINDFDGNSSHNKTDGFISSNGNLDNDVLETGEFPRNNYWTFTIKDNGTGWGGNVDFNIVNLPDTITDLSKITLKLDIKLTKAMNVNVMIARGSDVWGKTLPLVIGWNQVSLSFNDMGSGYGGTFPPEVPLPPFKDITGVKIQPPAQTANANFGEKISIDNIKFIIAD